MPRIAGVDIPENKKVRYSLRYIYGIGPKIADDILEESKIDPDTKARDLTDDEVGRIAAYLDSNLIVEGTLRRQVQQNIQRLRDIRSYRGERHRKGLPTRGQRTRCNARTRKGRKKTVAGKKGVKG
ncbi:MAG: 30S ribosomal protein S13 [Phycisphaerae bacterium]|jgi:small subunit ribosomal protein S13|nr:30S ribosomal protein S13 [Phycisphaerae bacterium]MBT5365876.1 30S ribosomal protein S13 [Phycisphaerae bacterium]MBT6268816.1 30S ribosomal protein S13 [Phycisphaerae bacterium]MBT6282795.1 30S ribosomal protein S13 [Phycisphaerae bacterium]